ncbi:hypothetical protein [Streptomyces sp. NPDC050121]|uniref:hypothetical protein n=1 Tax=Streptomyces sp. NPDC050121 TaxID=3365601 RepID=UPI003790A284
MEFVLRGPHATVYRHYRLEISRNSGATETQLARVRFVAAPTGQAFTGYRTSFAVLRLQAGGEANLVAVTRSVAVSFRRSRTLLPCR